MPRIDKNETPEDRFKRLAAARASKAIAFIRAIGNLSDDGKLYKYDQAQVGKMFDALFDELERCHKQYIAGLDGAKPQNANQLFMFE